MKNLSKRPKYPNKPVRDISKLEAALRIPIDELIAVSSISNSLYRDAKPIVKADGTTRHPVDALPRLKKIQKKIKEAFLLPVVFPRYITGSVRGSDARRNAALHAGASTVLCEDIKKFFPSSKASLVNSIWGSFFKFGPDVAELLTKLTTKDGALPEGAVTSSYLANLAFWDCEHSVVEKIEKVGFTYSRYVDDITVSSRNPMSNECISMCIASIYGMMFSRGYKPKRRKQEIGRGQKRMLATKHVVNERVALTTNERSAIRSAVFQLERQTLAGADAKSLGAEIRSLRGRVGRLLLFHPREGLNLKRRIEHVIEVLQSRGSV